MSDRTDRKLQQVAVGRYTYRHEAEFAAGFLRDAGIPYRLQIDDPVLGTSISSPATIWVLGIDERRARELLDIEESPPESRDREVESIQSLRRGPVRRTDRIRPGYGLSLRERAVALIGGGALLLVDRLFLVGIDDPIVPVAVAVAAALLVVFGLAGRAPRVLRELLAALSGGEP